jgi:hypothetical protein
VSKLGEFVESLKDGVLCYLLCIGFTTHDGQRLEIETSSMRGHEVTKRVDIAIQDKPDLGRFR